MSSRFKAVWIYVIIVFIKIIGSRKLCLIKVKICNNIALSVYIVFIIITLKRVAKLEVALQHSPTGVEENQEEIQLQFTWRSKMIIH
jgi:predicted CDP-diglyceride synthetase/phosphatidate cytidylyltransferase